MYQLTNIGKTYKQGSRIVTALAGVDLTIEDGDHVAIQGQTGGGKSTLLQLLGALDRPSTGSILLDGKDLARMGNAELGRVRARRIGFVFQSFNLIPTLTAQENVETALAPLGVAAADRRRRAAEALASVGLDTRATHLPSELSGGQQQRVAIARALVKDPSVLLADEPTGALDEETRDDIIGLLERIRDERGITLVVVTHDSWVARRAARRLHLKGGALTERAAAVPA
jgi:putative ABC transport system ATP-binding protein